MSGITRPATTTSPSPQLASITRSSAPLIGFCVNITPAHVGVEQRLDDDADARAREEPDALAVGDRRVGVRRPPDLPQRRARSSADGTLSSVRCWPAKLARRRPRRPPTSARRAAPPSGRTSLRHAARSPAPRRAATASTTSPESATPGGSGRPGARRLPSPMAFDAEAASRRAPRRAGRRPFTRAPSLRPRRRRRGRARRRGSARSPRACRPRRGCRTRARRSPSARAGRRCR